MLDRVPPSVTAAQPPQQGWPTHAQMLLGSNKDDPGRCGSNVRSHKKGHSTSKAFTIPVPTGGRTGEERVWEVAPPGRNHESNTSQNQSSATSRGKTQENEHPDLALCSPFHLLHELPPAELSGCRRTGQLLGTEEGGRDWRGDLRGRGQSLGSLY